MVNILEFIVNPILTLICLFLGNILIVFGVMTLPISLSVHGILKRRGHKGLMWVVEKWKEQILGVLFMDALALIFLMLIGALGIIFYWPVIMG